MALSPLPQATRSASDLQKTTPARGDSPRRRASAVSLLVSAVCFAGVLACLAWAFLSKQGPVRVLGATEVFFAAGALMLTGGLALNYFWLGLLGRPGKRAVPSLTAMGIRNCARRPRRSLSVIALLACGIFIVTAVGINRVAAPRDPGLRSSGTGGFRLMGETILPILVDLNSSETRRRIGTADENTGFVPIRVRDGDDASCLNLNRTHNPRILGVEPRELHDRGAFSFAAQLDPDGDYEGWLALQEKLDQNTIPAIADQTVIRWGLGKSLGDTLTYRDDAGRQFKIKLVGGLAASIFQGSIVIAAEQFRRRFPSTGSVRMFLVDNPAQTTLLADGLKRTLRDLGLELVRTEERLARFNRVQNTYLAIFFVLGGLGLMLGSIGLAVIVLRNVLERRSELAILRATGFSGRSVQWLVLCEHWLLLLAGSAVGLISAVIAVLPSVASSGMAISYGFLAGSIAAVVLTGALWITASTAAALRGPLLPSLRGE